MQFGGSKLVKEVTFGNKKLIKGINTIADAVGSTLGASGRTVVLEDDFGNAHVTKDGVTVAESILVADPVENLGVTLMKAAAKQTASKAGDGTTTSTVIAQAIIEEYILQEGEKHSFRDIKSGIDTQASWIVSQLSRRSVNVDEKRLENVSVISANNDSELGGLIAEAFKAAGENGVVTMETSQDSRTYADVVDGTQLTNSAASPHFFTDADKETGELEAPLIFLSATSIPNVRKIQDILEYAIKQNKAILLVAPLENQPMTALAMNKVKGNIKVSVVEPPSFGLKRKDLLDDLALLVGATVFDDSLGDSLDAITPDLLGSADKVIQDRDGTVIVVEDKPQAVVEKIEELRGLLEKEDHYVMKSHFEKRLALLCGGVSRIYVGADTEPELKEKKDRVDDAIHAVKAAKKEGILPGGGAALYHLATNNTLLGNAGQLTGATILNTALLSPFNKILKNAGLKPSDYTLKKWGLGVDVTDGKIKDMRKAGIIDPTLVTKEAVINAVSVATTILSTDAIVSNIREV